jgi:choline/carnitine/betaine transport
MSHLTHEETAREQRAFALELKRVEDDARKRAIRDREQFRGLQIAPTASFEDDAEGREPGDQNWTGYGFDLHPHVTFVSTFVLVGFILLTLMFKEDASEFFKSAMEVITTTTGWFLILVANVFVLAAFYFAFGRFGRIRLGGNDAKPEFTTPAWFAMLLSAGMGIGLMFWSVGEPIFHYASPSPMFTGVQAQTPEAAQAAMGVTYFHWGLHPWAVYAIVGLGLAFFAYNRGLPLTMRSVFYPLLGNKIYGFWGNLIDVLSVLATLVGLATSLGLGVKQINAGLNSLFGVGISTTTQVTLIAVITAFAALSVMSGLDKGVKRLSQANMILAAVFVLFLLLVGPTIFILSGFTQNLGYYLTIFPELSLWTETFRESNWQGSWTVFYWAWWISWSPFVGMFIARVSRGRTVREFVICVLIIPMLVCVLWMNAFGGTAVSQFINEGYTGVTETVTAWQPELSLFKMLEPMPLANITSFIGIVLVIVFFVTSSDSGSLVIDTITAGGKLDAPLAQRVFWCIFEGLVAIALLLGGGLASLQAAAIATGFPFAIVLVVMCYSTWKGLREEVAQT